MADVTVNGPRAEPRGPKPRRAFSAPNIFVYGTLIVVSCYYALPLYVMIVTSLKSMPEIRLGNVFSLPRDLTVEPWIKAWATACTGINCDGLSRGFWNSVRILIPSVILSIAIASVNGFKDFQPNHLVQDQCSLYRRIKQSIKNTVLSKEARSSLQE